MENSGPIILVEDDKDDRDIFVEALRATGSERELIWFKRSRECMHYLCNTTDIPFLIFCDINMPEQSGMEFKRAIDADPYLRKKSIPFLFYTTSSSKSTVEEAYMQLTIQGFFEKKHTFSEITEDLQKIIRYWELCIHPNVF